MPLLSVHDQMTERGPQRKFRVSVNQPARTAIGEPNMQTFGAGRITHGFKGIDPREVKGIGFQLFERLVEIQSGYLVL